MAVSASGGSGLASPRTALLRVPRWLALLQGVFARTSTTVEVRWILWSLVASAPHGSKSALTCPLVPPHGPPAPPQGLLPVTRGAGRWAQPQASVLQVTLPGPPSPHCARGRLLPVPGRAPSTGDHPLHAFSSPRFLSSTALRETLFAVCASAHFSMVSFTISPSIADAELWEGGALPGCGDPGRSLCLAQVVPSKHGSECQVVTSRLGFGWLLSPDPPRSPHLLGWSEGDHTFTEPCRVPRLGAVPRV